MKKIALIFLVLTACLKSFSQHPIGTDSLSLQTLANSNTLVKSKGAIGSDSGFVNTVYPDTTSANYGKIKNYPGAQIRVGDSIWLRNSTATQWLNLSAGSGVTATSLTWQNTLDNGSALTHNNFSDMQGSDFFFDNGGIFTFNVSEFAIPYLSTPAGNQDIFIGADEFGNLYKKQLVLPVDSGGFSGTQDWQSTIDYGNRMRHHNTVHFVNYDWYMDSLGNTSEFSGQSATFDNPIGAYTEKHQDSANAYLYSQDTTEIQGTEVRVHPDSTHMQAWDASGNNTYFTLFRKGTVRTFASVADTLDAPVINFPQFHNADSSQNQINIDEQGNLYWTNKASGTGASDRFGIEDNLGLQDRAVDMQNFKFNYTNSKIGINTTGSLFAELQVGDPVIHNPVSPSDVNVAFHGLMYLSSDNVTNRSGVFAVVASNTNGFYPVYSVRRSRGTISLPTATQLGDTLFKYGAAGHNGTDFETYNSAGSQILAAGNHSLTSTPTMMSFGVTPIGTTTQLPSLTLNQDLGIQFNDYASTGSPHTGTVSGLLGYDASGNVIQTSVSGSGGITSESDPIANAKTITENDGYGLIETQTATQALSTNPSWTRQIDTFAIETRARGLKIADSIGSVISARVYVDTAFTIPAIYTDTVKYTKGSNTYTAALIDHSDDRLFGLNVTSGGGLTLNVTSGAFRLLDGNRYTSPGGSTTLATADPSLPRKDVIYVDNTGAIGHITGTAATNPTTPQVDPVTQLFLTEVTVGAGATTIGVTPTAIYDEPATDAFTGTNTGVTVNYTNTSNVQHLTQSADVSSWTTGQTITFTKNAGTLVASDYSSLSGFIKLKVALANTANIRVSFLNGTTVVSNVITLAAAQGFSKTVLTYQNIAIPISAFTFTNTTFNKIKITLAGTGGGFYLDYFQLQNGVSQSTLETDPVATAKTITVTPGIGMLGAASTQQLNVNPSFTTNVDTGRSTRQIITGGSLNKVIDSLSAIIGNGSSSYVVYLSKMGIISDADLSFGSSTFGTNQTAAIQTILNASDATHPLLLVWDVKVGIAGDSIKSNTTIIALAGCGAILRDNSDRSVLSNYHATPGTITDSNITIIGGIWNGNGYRGGVSKQSGAIPSYGIVVGIRMVGVKNIIIRDVTILNTKAWATSFFTVKDVLINNAIVDQGSAYIITQDGLHFNGYVDNIKVYGLKARCGDDALAFNTMNTTDDGFGNPMTFYVGKYGPETNIDVRDVYLDSSYFGIHIQSGNQWADNINIENVSGKAVNYWLLIDNYSGNPTGTTDPGPGNVGNVRVANVSVLVTSTSPTYGLPSGYGNALINCNVKKLTISNYKRTFSNTSIYNPAVRVGGINTVVNKLIIDGFSIDSSFNSTRKVSQIVIDSATVKSLSVTNSLITNNNGIDSSSIISVVGRATVNEIILNGISNNGIAKILSDSATVNYISATNIRHVSADTSIAPFYVMTADSVWDFVLSNYWGFKITDGTFHSTRGDGFGGLPPFLASSLLTDYSGATVAFSLRKLSSTYSGNCIKVRRSSDNTTLDIGFSGNTLNTTALLTFVGAGDGFVQTWYDQSGNSNNLTQATNANQPKIVSSGSVITQNSKPTVNFISASSTSFTLTTPVSGAAAFTAYEVGARTNSSSFLMGLMPNNGSTNTPYSLFLNGTSSAFVANATDQKTVSDGGSTAFRLFTTLNTVSLLSLWINGVSQTLTTSGGVISNTNMSIIGSRPFNGAFSNGYVSELIFYPFNKSGNNTAIWNNINTFYTIY